MPADTIEVTDMEMALASVKVIRSFLQKEQVSDDEMNKGMNEHVDKVYGKPFDKIMNDKCNKLTDKEIGLENHVLHLPGPDWFWTA